MNRITFITILFCFSLSISAQHFDNDNDNFRFFYDIGIERGEMFSLNSLNISSGAIFSITGSWFYTPTFGFRSGLSYISGLTGSDSYWRVPILFAIRSRTITGDFFDMLSSSRPLSWGETLRTSILAGIFSLLPTRLELNAGTSLGILSPHSSNVYFHFPNGDWSRIQTVDVSRRFASTLDINGRLGFQFWRICVNGNLGISYLLTRNVHHTIISPYLNEGTTRPSWFGNASFGATFRF